MKYLNFILLSICLVVVSASASTNHNKWYISKGIYKGNLDFCRGSDSAIMDYVGLLSWKEVSAYGHYDGELYKLPMNMNYFKDMMNRTEDINKVCGSTDRTALSSAILSANSIYSKYSDVKEGDKKERIIFAKKIIKELLEKGAKLDSSRYTYSYDLAKIDFSLYKKLFEVDTQLNTEETINSHLYYFLKQDKIDKKAIKYLLNKNIAIDYNKILSKLFKDYQEKKSHTNDILIQKKITLLNVPKKYINKDNFKLFFDHYRLSLSDTGMIDFFFENDYFDDAMKIAIASSYQDDKHLVYFEKLATSLENINIQPGSNTLLSLAVKKDKIKVVKILLKHKASVLTHHNDKSPIDFAVDNKNIKMINLLLDNGSLTKLNNIRYKNIAHFAVKEKNLTLLKKVYSKVNINEELSIYSNLLSIALNENQPETVAFLLSKKINILSTDYAKLSKLAIKNSKNFTDIHGYIGDNLLCIIGEQYLENNEKTKALKYMTQSIEERNHANIKCNNNQSSLLHYATQRAYYKFVMLLKQKGADLSFLDSRGMLAVEIAENYGYKNIANVLRGEVKYPPKWYYKISTRDNEFIGYGVDTNKEIAKSLALKEIASSISVKVQSTTRIDKTVINNKYNKNMQDTVSVSSSSILEGARVIKMENKDNLWYVASSYIKY